MFKFSRPLFLYDTPNEGAGGGATDGLPEHLKDKYIPADKHHGTVGALQQQINKHKSDLVTLGQEKQALEAQISAFTGQVSELQGKAAQSDDLAKKIAENENALKAALSLNTRLESLMRFPALLDESTLALVKSSSLEGQPLDEMLGKLNSKLSAAPPTPRPDPGQGATPPRPQGQEVKPEDVRAEAMGLMYAGKPAEFNAKMKEYYALLDAKKKFVPVEFDTKPGALANTPPEGGS